MNIAVVDDQIKETGVLCDTLSEYASSTGLSLTIDRFDSGEAFLAGYRPYLYAVIFLDIYMEKMTGIEAAEKIREVDDDVLLVFQTTSEEHRAEAFTWYASAYLIKSPDDGVLFRTLDHILHLHTEKNGKRFDFYRTGHAEDKRRARREIGTSPSGGQPKRKQRSKRSLKKSSPQFHRRRRSRG